MATKKDLVEAYSFSRRRLVTAFLSGAPGGREVEPSRPGRTVVGGLALAVLLVAGAAIASVLASRTPEDWNQVGLVVTRGDQPATYVILEEHDPPELIPVINITSAQLILGADVKATSVDQEVVDEQTPGIPIGILGAPQTLPRPKQFIETGWTACTDDGVGIAVDVSNDERVDRTTSAAIVVESAGGHWLIATSSSSEGKQQRAYRYPIAEARATTCSSTTASVRRWRRSACRRSGWRCSPRAARSGRPGSTCRTWAGKADRRPRSRGLGWATTSSTAAGRRWSSTAAGSRWTRSRSRCWRTRRSGTARTSLDGGGAARDVRRDDLHRGALARHEAGAAELGALRAAGRRGRSGPARVAGGLAHRGRRVASARRRTARSLTTSATVTLDRGHGAFVQVGTWDETQSDSIAA